MLHTIIPTEYNNYASILKKHTDVLSEVNKCHGVHLLKMSPYKKHTALKYTYEIISITEIIREHKIQNATK